ncbi:MAG: HEAT repeat domain-containing protein [Planctomycetaceae bacterium]
MEEPSGSPKEETLSRVCALLESADPELSAAAARVLGALRRPESRVVEALGRALKREQPALEAAALDALAALGGAEALSAVVPLLNRQGEVGNRAMEVVAGMGSGVLGFLAKELERSGENGRKRILQVAARLRGAEGVDLLLTGLKAGYAGPEAVSWIAEALNGVGAEDRARLASRLEQFLRSDRVRKSPRAAAEAAGLLAGIAGPKEQGRLLQCAVDPTSPAARGAALEALQRVARESPLDAEVVQGLFGLITDPDYTQVAARAMRILESVALPAAETARILGHLKGGDPALKRFAANALGQIDTAKSAEALLELLRGDNPELQKRSAVSLARLKSAVPLVVEALAAASDATNAWVLARILMPQIVRLKGEQVSLLADAGAAWLETGDPRGEAIVALLRERHMDALLDAGMARVKRLKRGRKAGEILNLLSPPLRDAGAAPVEIRYEMALAEILRGKKDVVREARAGHPGLRALEGLARDAAFDLLGRLRREKSYLVPEAYYLIGCHFAERHGPDRALGGELLRWLVKTFPEEPVSQPAANKLVMEGFPPPALPRQDAKPAAPAKTPPSLKEKPAKAKGEKPAKSAQPKRPAIRRK